jgi:hypothetical protein
MRGVVFALFSRSRFDAFPDFFLPLLSCVTAKMKIGEENKVKVLLCNRYLLKVVFLFRSHFQTELNCS